MTPKFRKELSHRVSEEMNRIFKLFVSRNPTFDGKVILYGHSLGSLLGFDIMCNQTTLKQDIPKTPKSTFNFFNDDMDLTDMFRMFGESRVDKEEKEEVEAPLLTFSIDKFFGNLINHDIHV